MCYTVDFIVLSIAVVYETLQDCHKIMVSLWLMPMLCTHIPYDHNCIGHPYILLVLLAVHMLVMVEVYHKVQKGYGRVKLPGKIAVLAEKTL